MPAKGEITITVPYSIRLSRHGLQHKFLQMKRLIFSTLLCLPVIFTKAQQQAPKTDSALLQPVEVNAVRAADKAPFAKTNLSRATIEKSNLAQDIPFLLNQIPSVVVNSDAGTGVGYTGIRIRGTDATRINVTLNGIPYNDAESQGTFFVDLPDFASSLNSLQVQRGVGTSTNGAGSFGGTINLATNGINKDVYGEINNSIGSYNTVKNTFRFGTGLLGKHITFDGRLSNISSDGYIDRAKSNLRSAYASLAWTDSLNSFRFNFFTGKEKTYQAWYGVPEYLLNTDRTYNSAGLDQPGKPYENETDNYVQNHYQLFYNHKAGQYWKLNLAGFYTKGYGYYEQYKAGEKFSKYGLPDYNDGSTTYTKTDLVRRLWLNNDFYGTIFSAQQSKDNSQLIIGGGWNKYTGQHYGELTWAGVPRSITPGYRWYDLPAVKTDFSLFTKWTEQWGSRWQSFIDLQFRTINYRINGFRDNPDLFVNKQYAFFNPKLGITYTNKLWEAYASWAVAGHEPNRDDFEANPAEQPKPELLNDLEAGVTKKGRILQAGINLFYMKYKDQLVLTGKINDVGAYTRTNIPNSYRLGIELQATVKPCSFFSASGNISLSENKVKNFTEYIDDYDNGGQKLNQYTKTDIAYSPSITAAGSLDFIPVKNGELSLISKYVGRQYLDNTSDKSRSLGAFYVQDIRAIYKLKKVVFKEMDIILQANNIFSRNYEPNGYTFSYIYGGKQTTENYYFPMAPANFMVGVNVKL